MNSSTLSNAARARREDARLRTGEFGAQEHSDPGLVSLPDGGAADRFRAIFDGSGLNHEDLAHHMAGTLDAYTLKVWAGGRLDGVGDDQIVLAFEALRPEARDELDQHVDADPNATFARVDSRFARVADDAIRREAALSALTGQPLHAGPHETTGAKYNKDLWDAPTVAKDVRADLRRAYAEGLLPSGTTTRVTTSRYAYGQSISIQFRGVNDRQIVSELTLADGHLVTETTPYARALRRTALRIANAYNRRAVDSQTDYSNVAYQVDATFESDRAAARRLAPHVLKS